MQGREKESSRVRRGTDAMASLACPETWGVVVKQLSYGELRDR